MYFLTNKIGPDNFDHTSYNRKCFILENISENTSWLSMAVNVRVATNTTKRENTLWCVPALPSCNQSPLFYSNPVCRHIPFYIAEKQIYYFRNSFRFTRRLDSRHGLPHSFVTASCQQCYRHVWRIICTVVILEVITE